MKIKVLLLIIFIIICVLFLFYRNNKLNLHHKENKIEKFNDDKNVKKVILYHANWCGHCKHFLPIWEKFVENNIYKNILFDNIESNDFNEKENNLIKAFPTIIFINGTNQIQSVGEMTQDELKEKINTFFNIVQ